MGRAKRYAMAHVQELHHPAKYTATPPTPAVLYPLPCKTNAKHLGVTLTKEGLSSRMHVKRTKNTRKKICQLRNASILRPDLHPKLVAYVFETYILKLQIQLFQNILHVRHTLTELSNELNGIRMEARKPIYHSLYKTKKYVDKSF